MTAGMAGAVSRPPRTSAAHEGSLLAAATTCLVLWQVGVYVDVWYHVNRGFEIESFFTWAHALLYGGWAASGLVPLAFQLWSGTRLPRWYRTYLLGVALFGVGGGVDFVWHSLFGFDVGHETVLSPAHLWLAISFALTNVGLLQAAAAWRHRVGASTAWLTAADLPLVLALAMLLRVSGWYIIYADPLTIDFAAGGAVARELQGYAGITWDSATAQIAGTSGIFLRSLILALFLVAPLRYLRLPGGSIALMMLYDALLIVPASGQWAMLPAVAGAALAGELLWAWIRRGGLGGPNRDTGYWMIGGGVPLVLAALTLASLDVAAGVPWTPHLWAGVPVAAGILGLTAAMLAVPPAFMRAPKPMD